MTTATRSDRLYAPWRRYVLAVLGRRCGWLATDEREAIFHDAYVVLLQKERDGELDTAAMDERQVRAYLVQTAINKALDEGKRAGRSRERPLDDVVVLPPDPTAAPEEVAESSQTGDRVREIVSELPERQQAIVKLRFFFDRNPDEIQGYLGISERIYRRELERAMRRIAGGYELVREGTFCDSRRSAIAALVAGIAGPGPARLAREHLASCHACARWAVELRAETRRAAALLPLPAVVGERLLDRLVRLVESVRDALAGQTSAAKHHATDIATRVETGFGAYAGARPGAAVMAVAGCIAVGGGATYCAVEGVPDVLKPPGIASKARERPRPEPAPQPAAAPAPVAPAAAPVAESAA
ncbi:MAG: sigma-70 family RNA polymerase sigma factor, partial [Solirubrobacterales bacterium]|nr:sigma-70 family RNA polymerase sigma factor [Solirubrobacterales bacterium]